MKNVDLDEPTSFLDLVFLGCTQSECKPNETIVEEFSKMFELRISAGATDNYWCDNNRKDILNNASSDAVNWHTRKWSNFKTVSSLCLDDHQFKQEELESVGELSKVCSQVVLKNLIFGTYCTT